MRKTRWALVAASLCVAAAPAAAAPTAPEAARFLTQATFGPTSADIDAVVSQGYDGWLTAQFNAAPTLHRPQLEAPNFISVAAPAPPDRQEVWWRHSITASDAVRQRVAFALSEILVVSDVDGQLFQNPLVLAEYYDTLLRGAFGNYRTLLEDVTLSPAMGIYLSMIRNDKPNATTGQRPDENYAREVMQLFSIGLWQLNADGTPVRVSGSTVPTYSQETIENFARAYTGWGWADGSTFWENGISYQPMKAYEDHHDTDAKTLLVYPGAASTLPPGQTAAQDLDAALDNIFRHPNVGPFIAYRLIQQLVTSNPSPAYVGRVAAAFNDNGAGARGDLKAVVRAVLMDPDARAAPAGNFGKLREPLLRLTALWRAFNATAANGKYAYPQPQFDWGQAALRAPSVFNFFRPDYAAPGAIALAGLVSPEFQIQTESPSVRIVNAFTRFARNQARCGTPVAGGDRTNVFIDICDAATRAADPAGLVNHLDLLLLSGRMPASMRSALVAYLTAVPAGDGTQRAKDAIFLVVSSPQFAVQK
jgi:uncharacterized protein (DUF1800 family)